MPVEAIVDALPVELEKLMLPVRPIGHIKRISRSALKGVFDASLNPNRLPRIQRDFFLPLHGFGASSELQRDKHRQQYSQRLVNVFHWSARLFIDELSQWPSWDIRKQLFN